jgi:hypothetical protein
MPSLYGRYVFGDLGSGRVFALSFEEDRAVSVELLAEVGQHGRRGLVSFGVDHAGEIYLCVMGEEGEADGRILRLVRSSDRD